MGRSFTNKHLWLGFKLLLVGGVSYLLLVEVGFDTAGLVFCALLVLLFVS